MEPHTDKRPGVLAERLWILPAVLPLLLALPLAALMGATAVSHAQISPYPVVVTMTGPVTAVSGQEITYLVEYRLTDPGTVSSAGFAIVIPQDTTYVSSEVVSGPAGAFSGETADSVRWSFVGSGEETEGAVALTVRIGETFVGLIRAWCFVPGTETFNPESRCSIETEVFAVGALPEAGAGAPAAGSGQESACDRPREPGELAVMGGTTPSVNQGIVRIPELDLTSEIVDGCFEFRNLTLPQDPMLVSFEIRVEGFRPATWANFIVLAAGSAPIFTPRLEPGDTPVLFDRCPGLLSTPQEELSAAGHQHAQLCAQLPSASRLPEMGAGPVAHSRSPLAAALLALAGAALVGAGTAMRRQRRAR